MILGHYDVAYYQCTACGFVQTEEPFWLEEAYGNSINISDTGLMLRNQLTSQLTAILLYRYFNPEARYLDYAGGYGIFTRLMRDIGFDFYWEDKFCVNLVSRGFERNDHGPFECATAFEAFEHFQDPLKEISRMLEQAKSIFFSTEVFSGKAPHPEDWKYYGFHHGQHVSLFSTRSLEYLAEKFKLHLYTDGNGLHLLSTQVMPKDVILRIKFLRRIGYSLWVKKCMQTRTYADHALLQNSDMRSGDA